MSQILDEKSLTQVLEIARFAPSVHNSQPWLVKLKGNSLIIKIDPKHKLVQGDPTGRETIISLGIFTESMLIGLRSIGMDAQSVDLKNSEIYITLKSLNTPVSVPKSLYSRCTDRSIYKPTNIPPELSAKLKMISRQTECKIYLLDDSEILLHIADLTSKGIKLALSNPDFRSEISNFLVRPNSRNKRGINTQSLYLGRLLSFVSPALVKTSANISFESKLEKKRWLSASGVIVITSKGDLEDDWIKAGTAYLLASLAIEEEGLSQATSAAIVEASDFHEDLEKAIGTDSRILAIIRIGQGSSNRKYSPRVNPEDLIA